MRKNLLIGAVTNYVWDDIAPFFNSYMQAGFENCECVMFTGNMSKHAISKMRSYGVNVQPIPEEIMMSDRIAHYRFKLYYDFISERRSDYDMVLAADVRDIIFQRDLFKLCDPSKPFLGAALEDNLIGNEPSNSSWVLNGYGEEMLNSVKDKPIICMGTIWGTCNEFLRFISEITRRLEAGKAAGRKIEDQGSGNVILYTSGIFDDIIKPSSNYDGYVMTIGFNDPQDIHIDSAGNVINGKGEIAALFHQYNRKPAILDIIAKKYCADMSAFSRAKLKHGCDNFGRVLGFLSRVHRRGLFRSVLEAVKRRI